ncbi:serine/threonine protein kinase [Ketobacter nezhaii]|uniref:serine/threonine protein kinase n=1 Tax=Ketobacter sp. MCCC 1A13808 TaxID=2602738 RepID=UPI0012EB66A8|nr:serine/threonine-protein kinase [Ketobacter sp. MCCC 1A13808]
MSTSEHRLALPVGTVLQQFRIEAVLGYGGFGIVYKGRHQHLDEIVVAIKEYLPQEIATRDGATVFPLGTSEQEDYEEGMTRFLAEAKQLLQFDHHPNIVSCRDFFEANGTAYLVMKFEDGMPLNELIRLRQQADRPLSEQEILQIILPLLDGLKMIHDHGVLHRDIKPGNVFMRRGTEDPVLIDFGAAKQNFSKHSKSNAPYSVGYAAFEQVHSDGHLGPWTDIHAVGGIMWRILSGKNPIPVETRLNALLRQHPDPMTSALELGSGHYSPAFLEAIDKCLKINEEDRFQDAETTALALQGRSVHVSGKTNIDPDTTIADDDVPTQMVRQKEPAKESVADVKPTNNTKWIIASLLVLICVALASLFFVGNNLKPEKDSIVKSEPTPATPETQTPPSSPPTPKPPPTSLVTHKLWINADPQFATIELLNSKINYAAGVELPAQRYQVRISATGYTEQSIWVDLSQNNQTVSVTLTPESKQYQLWVNTSPSSASIRIPSTGTAYQAGMSLNAGQYELEVSAPGYISQSTTADLRSSDQRLAIVLEKIKQPPAPAPAPSSNQSALEEKAWANCQVISGSPQTGEAYFTLPAGVSSGDVLFKVGRFRLPLRPVLSSDKFISMCQSKNCYKVRANYGLNDYSATGNGMKVNGKACFYAVGKKPHHYILNLK